MSPILAIIGDGKKFMWDGQLYESYEDAVGAADLYQKENFEVRIVTESGQSLVYTRRLVKGVTVTAR
jgi:hypothetical protein